jgi:flagellar basal body-associated protein FliL
MHTENDNGDVVTHISRTEARAGSPTRVTRNILFISLALIIILFAIALMLGFFQTGKTGADAVTADNTAQSAPN